MIERAVNSGIPAKWVTADAVHGSGYHFRFALESQGLGYVVGVRSDFAVWAGGQRKVKTLLADLPTTAWQRLICGTGSKGLREYDWAITKINSPESDQYARWLLIRRRTTDQTEIAFFACGGPPEMTL